MKKKFLMVISTITVITGLFILTTGSDKVRADESGDNSCETITNYYMFLDAVASSWFSEDWCTKNPNAASCTSDRIDSKGYHLNTAKNFNLGVDGIVLEEGTASMSASKFYDIYSQLTSNQPMSFNNDNTKVYIRATKWFNSSGIETDTEASIGSKDEFVGNVNPATDSVIKLYYDKESAHGTINRTWSSSDAQKIFDKKLAVSYSPSVYYITYTTCGAPVTITHFDDDASKKITGYDDVTKTGNEGDKWEYSCPAIDGYNVVVDGDKKDSYSGTITDKAQTFTCHYSKNAGFKVTVKYLEKGTDKELAKAEVVKSGLKDKENYKFTCKDNISKYDLVTKDEQSVTINGKDAEAVCYYEKESYLLTINYGDDEECSNPLKSADTQSVKWGESVEVKPGNKIGSMTLTGLGTYSSQISPAPRYSNGVVTLTMPEKNASICVVYTPQTGSAIGKVMLLGTVALGGTMFFIKRNKEEDEIEA